MSEDAQQVRSKKKTNILDYLLDDPTRSVRDIAKDMGTYRQKVWRIKNKLEEEQVVWGYTAIIDEGKINHVVYLLLMKMKPMDMTLAELVVKRIVNEEFCRQNVRLIDSLYVNGQYDWVMLFSAPDHATARRYYDCLRVVYEDYLLEKPVMVDVNFCLVREGKKNPDIKRLLDFVPV